MTQRSLVTGGAGVIGRELVTRLVARGSEVRVVDLQPLPDWMPASVDYIQADLAATDPSAVSSFDPSVLYHLAATFERSEEQPTFWEANSHHNITASHTVLRGALDSPALRRYVFASSYLTYDSTQYLTTSPPESVGLLAERSALDPRNVTGAAKLLHERELELVCADPDVTFTPVSARIYRVYGCGSRDVISRWVRSALRGERITTYGVESYFDYVYAGDVAEALLRLSEADLTGPVNVATGQAHRVSEVLDELARLIPDISIDGPSRAGEYEASQAAVELLEKSVGWTPTTALADGIAAVIEHEQRSLAVGRLERRLVAPVTVNTLVTSVSRKSTLVAAVRDAYESLVLEGSLWGADTDESVPTRESLDRFWVMPRLDVLSDDELVSFCRRERIGLLVPTRDGELARFAEARDALAAIGTFVPIGSPESVRAAIDKIVFAERCAAAGLLAPPTALNPDDLGPNVERFVVKGRFGAGSTQMAVDLDRSQATTWAASLADPLVQQMVDGPEYSVDVYVRRDGTSLGAVARRRDLVVGGESQVTTVVDRPDLTDLGVAVVQAIEHRGHAVVQIIDSAAGPSVIECNPRVGGASAAAFAAGLRSLELMLLEATGMNPAPRRGLRRSLTLERLPADRINWT